MRSFYILILLPLLILFTQAHATAATSSYAHKGMKVPRGSSLWKRSASISYWSTSGYFEMEGGPPAAGNRWILEHPTDGRMHLYELEFRRTPRLSFDFSMGFGIIDDGTIIDTDIDAVGVVSNLSHSTSSGSLNFLGANAYLRVYHTRSTSFDLSIGYLFLKSSVDYSDPNLKISNYLPSALSWQELWLTYNLIHHGIRLGARGEVRLNNSLSIKAGAGVIPLLQAYYDGLRFPERPIAQQRIEGIDADGLGLDAIISAEFAPYKSLVFLLGYKYISFETKGRDRANTPWAGSWEEFSMELKGPFAAFAFSF